MAFFFDPPEGFTHYALFYGFSCYYRADGPDGCELAGTNLVADWCIEHVAPVLHWVCETIRLIANPREYEPGGWNVELRGEIERQ